MNMPSENLIKSTIEEKQRQAARFTKQHRTAGSTNEKPMMNFWQLLKDFAKQLWGAHRSNETIYSERNLYHAEKLGVTPEELALLLEKSRLYERIAHGNALIEADNMSQKLWERN
ncbi:MAG: hypothetical protein RLP44_19395 [Aggregatilineales bacterium]